jgi:diguanylate cyclase (GGDEF)-like protein
VIDAHTGAYLKGHFELLVEQHVRAAKKKRAPLALLWVDVDELTEANDAHGREAVDAALAVMAQTLSEALDGKGPIGRVRGGTFAALLPGLKLEPALALAEKVRAAQAAAKTKPRLKVSCGVAVHRPAEPWGNLLEAAEAACVRAKQAGRDAVAS